nr:MAG TPA_asm: Protein of unknown function (DUF2802) [Caudoviricetes sp.]
MIVQMMMQAAQQGMSPQQFFQQYAGNPEVAKIAQIAQGKNHEQLMQTASNMAQQRGITLDTLAQQMGIPYKGQ